jgi:hypothetical protein
MSRYPGWISLLLDADESQYVYNWSNLTRREPYGKIKCDEDGHSITRVNEPYTAWRTATEPTLFNTNKIPRPRPNLGTWWRDNGVYSLVYGSEEKFYFDKGDDGHANDLPDFIITIGAGWGPGGVAALQDRYGNTYGSGNLGLSVKGGLYLGEGYVSNTWTGFNSRTLVSAYIPTETELQKAIITLGPAANAAAIIGAGVSVNDCDTRYNIGPCYFATLFTTGIQLTVGVNWGATTQPQSKVTEEAWNWMLSEPGPTRDEVWQRWLKSVADNPCGECSAAK